MGRGGRWHHLPQGIQAAVVRAVWWGLVDGHELLLVLAAAQCAVVVVPEPGAFLPPQPDVIQLPEPHAPRQPQPRLPPPIPPWPPQPAPAPGLQQQGVKQTLIGRITSAVSRSVTSSHGLLSSIKSFLELLSLTLQNQKACLKLKFVFVHGQDRGHIELGLLSFFIFSRRSGVPLEKKEDSL
uniref:Uncharacterized protein n=1 Tax=Triticum urartu TaxID=4572 RepID=A0A8R7R270_TRIUA